MVIQGIANYFQPNSIVSANGLWGQNPLLSQQSNDALQRLSENMLAAQDQRARFDTVTLSAEALEQTDNSPLEDMPDGLLEFYLHQYKFAACISQSNEANLMEYRDQLTAFDQTIQNYQDMLDGKSALPDQLTMEDVSALLESTKAAREKFLQEGAQKLNQFTSQDLTAGGNFLGKAYSMAGGSNSVNSIEWTIDPSAEDIYAEIDRVLAATRSVTQTFQQGASAVLAEMKRRGLIDESYQLSFEVEAAPPDNNSRSCFQDIYDELWTTYRPSMQTVEETYSAES